MKKALFFFVVTFALGACQKESLTQQTVGQSREKSLWSSNAQWAMWTDGLGDTIYNDVWGKGATTQTLWVNSFSNWGVIANQPNTGGIKSYPNCEKWIYKPINTITSCTSSFNVTLPSSGAWEATYDIWYGNNTYEIMLWMDYTGTSTGSGNVKPIASTYDANGNAVPTFTNQSIGGYTWNVFKGSNGANQVYSFLNTTKTDAGTVDVKAISNWLVNQGWLASNEILREIQFGFEITSSYAGSRKAAGLNFTTNSYSVSTN